MIWLLLSCAGPDVAKGFEFADGDFDFTTVLARDLCLGGAMEALFMPEGPDTPHPFEFPIRIPSYDQLPTSYEIDLRAPFLGMPVTVEDGGDGMFAVRGSVMESVVLDASKYGDCEVTMTVDADLWPASADHVDGEARIQVSDARGAEELCPVFTSDPCEVTLVLAATRH